MEKDTLAVLRRRTEARREAAERLRRDVRASLKAALSDLLPGQTVLVYDSVTRPGGYRPDSDVDVALLGEPAGMSVYRLQAELEERVGCRVDVVMLAETRLRGRIEQEGERWTSPGWRC